MPYKNPQDKIKYNRKYYWRNRKKIKTYKKIRKEQNKKAWQKWWLKKKDKIRKEKIKSGTIYKPKVVYTNR